jgi:predicted Rossmann fold nucleotide-binding protein DprA/Smf involved in DNA uptake
MTYPNTAGFKEQGGTSQEAAESIDAKTLRELALAEIVKEPLTADEVAANLGQSVLAIRPRVSELHRAGAIYKTARRRVNRSGKKAVVWAKVAD